LILGNNQDGSTSESARIAEQLRRMYEGPAWHGPALKEVLAEADEERVSARPLASVHTIWELVLHTAAWMRIARERLSATSTRDHTAEENWPPMGSSWTDALRLLDREERELEQAILSFPADRLNEPAPATEPQTFYTLLHGVVQHIAYHAGQMAILKK
jgi:uncharacterized damage-inducible protein DinB